VQDTPPGYIRIRTLARYEYTRRTCLSTFNLADSIAWGIFRASVGVCVSDDKLTERPAQVIAQKTMLSVADDDMVRDRSWSLTAKNTFIVLAGGCVIALTVIPLFVPPEQWHWLGWKCLVS